MAMCVPVISAQVFAYEDVETPQYNKQVTFSDAKEGCASDYDLGRQNMIFLGFDEELIDSLSQQEVNRYAHIESGLVNTKYIKVSYYLPKRSSEPQTMDNSYIKVKKNQLDQLEERQEIITKEAFKEGVAATKALQDKFAVEQAKDTTNVETTNSLNDEVTVFNDYMTLSTTITKINNTKYRVAGRYEWSTEPTKRYKDIFTFSPDSEAYFNDSSLYAISKCNFRSEFNTPTGGLHIDQGPKNKEYTDYNDMEYKDGGGYGIKVNVYKDGTDPWTGSPFGGNCKYTNFKGYIAGDMIVREPENPKNMKVIVNYSQQTRNVSASSISVNIPKGVSVPISPSSSFNIKESYISFRHPDFYEVS